MGNHEQVPSSTPVVLASYLPLAGFTFYSSSAGMVLELWSWPGAIANTTRRNKTIPRTITGTIKEVEENEFS